MNGHRHSIHPLRGQKEKVSDRNQLLMLNEKKSMENLKMAESKINVISQARYLNEFEMKMNNYMCSEWFMERKYKQSLSNA